MVNQMRQVQDRLSRLNKPAMVLVLFAMSFLFGGAAVFLLNDLPPQPTWVNKEDNTIDLSKVSDRMPVSSTDGTQVGYLPMQKDADGVKPMTDALGNYAVTDNEGRIVGYFVRVGEHSNAPYRFQPLDEAAR